MKLQIVFLSLNRPFGSQPNKVWTVQCTVLPTSGTELGSSSTPLTMMGRLVSNHNQEKLRYLPKLAKIQRLKNIYLCQFYI